jgi:hypothetical protein
LLRTTALSFYTLVAVVVAFQLWLLITAS